MPRRSPFSGATVSRHSAGGRPRSRWRHVCQAWKLPTARRPPSWSTRWMPRRSSAWRPGCSRTTRRARGRRGVSRAADRSLHRRDHAGGGRRAVRAMGRKGDDARSGGGASPAASAMGKPRGLVHRIPSRATSGGSVPRRRGMHAAAPTAADALTARTSRRRRRRCPGNTVRLRFGVRGARRRWLREMSRTCHRAQRSGQSAWVSLANRNGGPSRRRIGTPNQTTARPAAWSTGRPPPGTQVMLRPLAARGGAGSSRTPPAARASTSRSSDRVCDVRGPAAWPCPPDQPMTADRARFHDVWATPAATRRCTARAPSR